MYINEKYKQFFKFADGKFPIRYPSVTRLLSAVADTTFLEEWKARVGEEEAERISKASREFGDSVHHLLEDHFQHNPYEIPENIVGLTFKNIRSRIFPMIDEVVGIEVPIQSHLQQIQGRVDFIGIIKGELAILDWKTKNGKTSAIPKVWLEDYFIQCAMYAVAFKELTGDLPKKIHIVCASEFMCQHVEENLKDWIPKVREKLNEYDALCASVGANVGPKPDPCRQEQYFLQRRNQAG